MKGWIFIFLVVTSCRDEVVGVPKPKDLVPEDTMVMVLKDLTLLETHIQLKYQQVTQYKETMDKSGKVLFKRYNLSEKRFEASLDYYGSRQHKMQNIYARVLDSLNRMSGKMIVLDTIEKPKVDPSKLPGLIKIDIKK